MDAERGKLTDQRARIIVEAIGAGCPKYFACQKADIDYSNFRRWMIRGKAEQDDEASPYRAFRAAVKRAEAEAVARNAELIQHVASDGTWQAAAWWLERRYPHLFGANRHELAELKRRIEELERDQGHGHVAPQFHRNGVGKPAGEG